MINKEGVAAAPPVVGRGANPARARIGRVTNDAHSSPASGTNPGPATPFHDLDHFIALPRLSGLTVSPDGSRIVATVATLNKKQTAYVSALWQLDPAGEQPARRITRSAKGESGAAFAGNGELYFTSSRPDPDTSEDDEPTAVRPDWLPAGPAAFPGCTPRRLLTPCW